MSHPISVTAIVSDAPNGTHPVWRKEKVQLREPGEDELLVKIIASGICHTDIAISTFPEGVPGFQPYPKIMGHEGAGIVERVGSKISNVKKGDKVLLSFDYCSKDDCRGCEDDTPGYCNEFHVRNLFNEADVYQVDNGKSAGGLFFGQSSFSSTALVKGTSVVNVEQLVKDEEELKLFAPMGCGYQTGAAAVTELANVGKKDAVVVYGLGGVGMSAVMAASVRGAHTIIGVDIVQSRLELAKEMGATHVIDSSNFKDLATDIPAAIREIAPKGVNAVFDTTGVVPLISAAIPALHAKGQIVLIGVVNGKAMDLDLGALLNFGTAIRGCIEGNAKPSKFVPQMIEWYRQGKFPIEKLAKFYQSDDFEKALADMHTGSTIKPILLCANNGPPMRLKVGPSVSEIRERSEATLSPAKPAHKTSRHVKKLGTNRSSAAGWQAFSASKSLNSGSHVAKEKTRHRSVPCVEFIKGSYSVVLLERAAGGLGVEEEHSRDDDGGNDEEDQVVLPPNGLNSDGRHHIDHEIPAPVETSRQTGHGDAETCGRDFSAVQEVGAEEADGDEEVEQEHKQSGHDLSSLVGCRPRGGNSESQHAGSHASAGKHEQLAATEAVDGEEGHEAGQELPGKCATRQNARSLCIEAETLLEDDGRVGGDQIGTAHLLEKLQEHAERKAVEQLVLAVGENLADLDGAALGLLESKLNAADFGCDLVVVKVNTLEVSQATPGLLNAALPDQPSGRFRDRENSDHGDNRDDSGDREGNAPLQREVILLEETKVDPRLEQETESNEQTVEHNVLATVGRRRAFRLPDRNGSTELSDSPAENEAANNELRKLEGGALQDLSNKSAGSANEDSFAATELVAHPGASKRTEKSTQGEGSDNSTLLG
ncbi:hypothetical protein OPT61_g95 [Boeremia exigua]|uniref:Uncharacterized protein n=1 Tax=Boeremia exigua TaxID=749465 RepID=A0ACC2IV02_9PLEO|nr:hypothetical protein OPT61_g95 [Boeremia exigua]